jgi:hypothetical protein
MLTSISRCFREPFLRRWGLTVLLPFLGLFLGSYAVAVGPLRIEGNAFVAFVIFIPSYVFSYFLGLSIACARPWYQNAILPPFGAVLALVLMVALPVAFILLLRLIPHPVVAGLLMVLLAPFAAVTGGFIFGCCLWAVQYLLFGYPRAARWRWLLTHGLAAAAAQYAVIAILVPLGGVWVLMTRAKAEFPAILFLMVMAAAALPHLIATGWLALRDRPFHATSRLRLIPTIVASLLALVVVGAAAIHGAPALLDAYRDRPPIIPATGVFEYAVAYQRYAIPVERVKEASWHRSTRSFEHVRLALPLEEFGLAATAILEDPRHLELAVVRKAEPARLSVKCKREFIPTLTVCWSRAAGNRAIDFWNMPADATPDVVDVPALGLRGGEMLLLDTDNRFLAALDRRYDYDRVILNDHGVIATISFQLQESAKMGLVVRRAKSLLQEMRR